MYRPGRFIGWRKLLILIDNLPPESAVNTAIRNDMPEWYLAERAAGADPSKSAWSITETLLAVLIDEVRMSNWLYASAHSDKTIPRPEPVRRPGTGSRRLRTLTLGEARAIDPRLRTLSDAEALATFRRLHGA